MARGPAGGGGFFLVFRSRTLRYSLSPEFLFFKQFAWLSAFKEDVEMTRSPLPAHPYYSPLARPFWPLGIASFSSEFLWSLFSILIIGCWLVSHAKLCDSLIREIFPRPSLPTFLKRSPLHVLWRRSSSLVYLPFFFLSAVKLSMGPASWFFSDLFLFVMYNVRRQSICNPSSSLLEQRGPPGFSQFSFLGPKLSPGPVSMLPTPPRESPSASSAALNPDRPGRL